MGFKFVFFCLFIFVWCNGSTAVFGTASSGSNPDTKAKWGCDAIARHTSLKMMVLWVGIPPAPPVNQR